MAAKKKARKATKKRKSTKRATKRKKATKKRLVCPKRRYGKKVVGRKGGGCWVKLKTKTKAGKPKYKRVKKIRKSTKRK